MSIYSYLEKVALDSMPRHRYAESAVPYARRKAEYKKFMQARAKARKPGNTEYVPGYAVGGGVIGGLVGAISGSGHGSAALGAGIGGLMGAGIGAIGGLAAASNEQIAIDEAKKVVRGGQYDKALQDEIIAYRRHKEMERQNERDWDRLESRLQHQSTRDQLTRMERRQDTQRQIDRIERIGSRHRMNSNQLRRY